jgi:hypothetical protein
MLGFLGSAFSFLSGLLSFFSRAKDREAGRQQQEVADEKAAMAQAQVARQVDSSVATDSDSDVDAKLRDFARKQ